MGTLRDRLSYDSTPPIASDLYASRFLFESPHVRANMSWLCMLKTAFLRNAGVVEGAALMAKIFREFKFDPEATTVSTPILEVLENKRGVCKTSPTL